MNCADDERRDEAADHAAEPAEHADHEDQRAELQADLRIDVVLQHHQRRREAGEPAADRRGDEIDLALVDAHQRHDRAVLRDRADRDADIGARQEQPEHQHRGERDAERDDARIRERHVEGVERAEPDAEVLEVDAEHHGGGGLQEEQHAAGDEQLVDRRGIEHRADDEVVQRDAGERDQHDAEQRRGEERHPALVGVVDAVHADHHQLGVADPHHVDDAEDQVEAEREQRQQAGEQQPVEDRLEEEDVELAVHQIPIYALRMSSLAAAPATSPLALMRPTSSR